VQKANGCSLRLHLIPASAKNARGLSHEIALHKARLDTDPDRCLSLDPTTTLVPSLARIRGGVSTEVAAAHDQLLESQAAMTRREEQAQERADELQSLKDSLAKLEKDEKRLRDEHADELAKKKAETEALEEQIIHAKNNAGANVAAANAEREALEKELAEFKAEAGQTRERIYAQLVSSLDMLTLHKEQVETQLAGLRAHNEDKINSLAPLLDDTVELS
jgi:SMC interacting uncharacterized protein involved in chromosome segregation